MRNEGDALGISVLLFCQNLWRLRANALARGVFSCLLLSTCLFFVRNADAVAEDSLAASAQPAAPVKVAPSFEPIAEREKQTLIRKTTKETDEPEAAPAAPRRIWDTLLIGLLALGAILWGGLYVVKKLMPGGRQLFTTPAMEVLGRSHLDAQRYLALVRIGERVVVVGVSPDGVRTITEFNHPDEVAQIMEVAHPKSEAGASVFARLFQDSIRGVKKQETQAEAEKAATTMSASIESLRERVRGLGQREDEGQ